MNESTAPRLKIGLALSSTTLGAVSSWSPVTINETFAVVPKFMISSVPLQYVTEIHSKIMMN